MHRLVRVFLLLVLVLALNPSSVITKSQAPAPPVNAPLSPAATRLVIFEAFMSG
ncbi:MAG TPA: hypothetical protein G4N99_08005 [Thermoflexia bacterium]|nr:hypothetical protein [Thermoflexia bacterium]